MSMRPGRRLRPKKVSPAVRQTTVLGPARRPTVLTVENVAANNGPAFSETKLISA